MTVPPVWLLLVRSISGMLTFLPCVSTDISNAVSGLSKGTTTGETNRPLVQNACILMLKLELELEFSKVELCHAE